MAVSDMYEKSLKAFLKPIAHFLNDPRVSEVMINGPEEIWVESSGTVFKTDARFTPEGLEAAARNMAQYVGRIINDERPRLDARLPDGSRIHVVLPPIGRKGTTIAIRKFFPGKLTVSQLVDFGSMTKAMARFIDACVTTAQNLVVSGGTGSGKTTLLNVVSSLIPNEERILTIEDSAELQLLQDHLVPFESRPPDKFGKGGVSMADLLASALRLRPDRIVIGEVRGGEAFDLIQSMNTGHSGSMCTVHANTPTDTLRRLESLCLMSAVDLPMVAVRAQVAAALNVVIQCARFHDGSRRVTHVSEVLPLNEKGDYRTQDIFVYTITGKDENGKFVGYHAPTGVLPTFLKQCHAYGFTEMDESFFDPASYGVERPKVAAVQSFETKWVSRLEGGEEHGEGQPFEGERLAELEKAFAISLGDRDTEPPPKWEEAMGSEPPPAQSDAEDEDDEPAAEAAAGGERAAGDAGAGDEPAAPQGKGQDGAESGRPAGSGPGPASRRLGLNRPLEPKSDEGGKPRSTAASILARQISRQKSGPSGSKPNRRLGMRPRPKKDEEE